MVLRDPGRAAWFPLALVTWPGDPAQLTLLTPLPQLHTETHMQEGREQGRRNNMRSCQKSGGHLWATFYTNSFSPLSSLYLLNLVRGDELSVNPQPAPPEIANKPSRHVLVEDR